MPTYDHGGHPVADAADVEHRHADEVHAGGGERPRLPCQVLGVGEVPIRQLRALRHSCGPRGVEQQGHVVGVGRVQRILGRTSSEESLIVTFEAQDQPDGGGSERRVRKEQALLVGNDDHGRFGVGHDGFDLRRRQSPVQAGKHRSRLAACEGELIEHRRVLRQHCDAVALADAGSNERVRQLGAAQIELRERARFVAEGERRCVRSFPCLRSNDSGKAEGRIPARCRSCRVHPVGPLESARCTWMHRCLLHHTVARVSPTRRRRRARRCAPRRNRAASRGCRWCPRRGWARPAPESTVCHSASCGCSPRLTCQSMRAEVG